MRNTLLSLAALAALSAPAWSQTTVVRSGTISKIQPGRVGDFTAAVKEFNEVLGKAGWTGARPMWRRETGPREYSIITQTRNYAALDVYFMDDPKLKDSGRELAAIASRINACIESTERILDEPLADLSVFSNDPVPLVRVLRTVVKSGMTNDFIALLRNELAPAAKRSGLKFYVISRTRYGGPASEFRFMSNLNQWADLDQPAAIRKAMGDDKYAEFQQKWASMVVENQYDIYRYLPELSYSPPRPNATSPSR